MKRIKKIASLVLALIMALAMTTTAFADTPETGSITITDNENGAEVAGKTFGAYKILDVVSYETGTDAESGETVYKVVYKVPEALKSFYQTRYTLTGTEPDFDYTVAEEIAAETDMYAFANAALKAAKDANISPATVTAGANDKSVTINNLPLGYYVVEDETATSTTISALMVDTTNLTPTIKIKADKPSLDKVIDGSKDTDSSTTGDVKYNNAAVGDKVPYKLTSKVPDMTGYKNYYFVVNDTLSKGLKFNNDVVIKIGDTTLKKDTDFTVTSTTNTATGDTLVEIVFINFLQYKAQAGEDILITYSAEVTTDAVIGVEGNPNKAKLIFSNNPNIETDGNKPGPQSPVGETPDVETRTYVTELKVIKVDDENNRLAGAEFEITGEKLNTVLVTREQFTEDANGEYWKLKDGTYTKTAPVQTGAVDDTTSYYDDLNKKYKKEDVQEAIANTENVKYTATVSENGELTFSGLAAGTYKITEIKAPAGYNRLETPIEVTIGWTAPTTGSTDCTWTYTGTDLVGGKNINQITVVNNKGMELPSTGGIGTTIFYVAGAILVLGAGVVLVTRKRMKG